MTYKDNAVKDLRIAYIGGGSRGWAWTFMRDLALELALGGTIVLYDIDKEAAKDKFGLLCTDSGIYIAHSPSFVS